MMSTRRPDALLLCLLTLLLLIPTPPARAQGQRGLRVGRPRPAPRGPQTTPPTPAPARPRLVVQHAPPEFVRGFSFVGFSPDGRLVAAAGAGGEVALWDVATGREVRRLGGNVCDEGWQESSLAWGAFSPDGRRLAVGTCSMVRLWDVGTGRRLRVLKHDDNAFWRYERVMADPPVAFSPDGRHVVVRGASEMTWDAATGRLVGRVPFKKKEGGEVVVTDYPEKVQSPDGRLWLAKDGDGWAVTERASGRVVRRVPKLAGEPAPGAGLVAYAVTSDASVLLTVEQIEGEDGAPSKGFFVLWDARTGRELRRLEGLTPGAGDYRFTPEGEIAEVSVKGSTVVAREMTAGREQTWELEGGHEARDVSPDRRLLVTTKGAEGKVWEAKTGRLLAHVGADPAAGKVFDRQTGEPLAEFKPPASGAAPGPEEFAWDAVGFTPDKTVTFFKPAGSGVRADLRVSLRVDAWRERWSRGPEDMTYVLDTTNKERNYVLTHDMLGAAWETDGGADSAPTKLMTVWHADPDFEQKTFRIDRDEAYGDLSAFALSPDARRVVVATSNNGGTVPQAWVKVWDARTGRAVFQLRSPGFRVGTVAWSPDGRTLATGAVEESGAERVTLWDAATGRELRRLPVGGSVREGFSPDGRRLLVAAANGFTVVYDVASGAELCRFVVREDGSWVVVAPDGRFDTDDLEEIRGVHWVAADDPLRPLPLEIFMRDYYEPRLLARLLAGEELKPVRSLAEVNRVQPRVMFKSVEQSKDDPGFARVVVEVARGEAGAGAHGVYDLRLFRDGRLVGSEPAGGGEVKLDAQTGAATLTFERVRLPRGTPGVEFTAYAFNDDRVKSPTARARLETAAPLPASKGRAYVVSVGVNAYENEAWDLRFAANDARRVQELIAGRAAASGEYEETVRVELVSDYEVKGGRKTAPRVVTHSSATKANFKAVLDLLAGREVDAETLRRIPGAERLRAATPEDLVVLTFSSHGYADERGTFYLLTYDSGADGAMAGALQRSISSDELSLWLREVDAGEVAFVVDACHSAASVQGAGFKPGPMGSRGLGQLAYDKGMRVLTSTQADDVALEFNLVEMGLLTYALTRDAVERAEADREPRDQRITVAEWLAYGVERVPQLHAEVSEQLAAVREGKAAPATLGRDSATRVVRFGAPRPQTSPAPPAGRGLSLAAADRNLQRPSLFDFKRRRRDAVLARD